MFGHGSCTGEYVCSFILYKALLHSTPPQSNRGRTYGRQGARNTRDEDQGMRRKL